MEKDEGTEERDPTARVEGEEEPPKRKRKQKTLTETQQDRRQKITERFRNKQTSGVREPKKKTKLERLACFPEVKAMIENSRPISEIVHHIQVVRQEYLEVKPEGLTTSLYQFIGRRQNQLIDCRVPTRYLNLLDSASSERVDPLDAVNMLFAIHMDRVMIDYAVEVRDQTTLTSNTMNLRLANEMVRTMSVLKHDMHKRRIASEASKDGKPKTLKETFESVDHVKKMFEERYGSSAAAVALQPSSRAKIHKVLSKVRKGDTEPVLKLLRENSEKAKQVALSEDGCKPIVEE